MDNNRLLGAMDNLGTSFDIILRPKNVYRIDPRCKKQNISRLLLPKHLEGDKDKVHILEAKTPDLLILVAKR
jgi:hypothetical protein